MMSYATGLGRIDSDHWTVQADHNGYYSPLISASFVFCPSARVNTAWPMKISSPVGLEKQT